ncbi:MAG TPA: hypothetical protein VFV05_00970 [Methylomirabilota bacterium]|nr:hypothetical protein [Methylomirabilota bacterium]
MDDTTNTTECGACGGSGVRWTDGYDWQLAAHVTDEVPCGECGGTGRTEAGEAPLVKCPACLGAGWRHGLECSSCRGEGVCRREVA